MTDKPKLDYAAILADLEAKKLALGALEVGLDEGPRETFQGTPIYWDHEVNP